MNLEGATVAVQGYGNVGSHTAVILEELGCKVIAVCDVYGGLYNEHGLDTKVIKQTVAEKGSVIHYKGPAVSITNSELLELPVDILVPAALENQITKENAPRVKAKIIAEGANGPTTAAADRILNEQGTFIIPDILANAGGVTVSYFEWVQGIQELSWTEEQVVKEMRRRMVTSFNDVYNRAKAEKVDMRSAAYLIAIERVAQAIKLRGFT